VPSCAKQVLSYSVALQVQFFFSYEISQTPDLQRNVTIKTKSKQKSSKHTCFNFVSMIVSEWLPFPLLEKYLKI